MPVAAKHPCPGGCGRLVVTGYCESCQAKGKGKDLRPSASARLYKAWWRKRSKAWLKEPGHQFCIGYPPGCHGDRLVGAELPDHIKAHKGDVELFRDESNWQPMCRSCNSKKAIAEEGGGWRRV